MTNKSTRKSVHDITRIVIIEDDATIRDGYAYLLSAVEGFLVANTYASFEEAAENIANDVADIILLDIQLPGITGVDALLKLKKLSPEASIIMLTVHEDPDYVFTALENGAAGYLTKNTPPAKIIEAIRDAVQGGGPMSANIARIVIRSFQKNQDSPLTKRESEVLQYIADGKSKSRISAELFIDEETVKTHVKNIYLKLNVHTRADAIKMARDNRFIR